MYGYYVKLNFNPYHSLIIVIVYYLIFLILLYNIIFSVFTSERKRERVNNMVWIKVSRQRVSTHFSVFHFSVYSSIMTW